MTNVNFYTHKTALGKVEQDAGAKPSQALKTAIEGLSEHKVTRSDGVTNSTAPKLDPAPEPTGGIMASLGKSQAKAEGMAQFFTRDSVKRSFADRLNNAADAKALKGLLHYSGPRSSKGAAARLETRAALSLAFANGASPERLTRLRGFLDGAGPDVRRNVRQELNRTGVDADAFIEKLVNPDQFMPVKVKDAKLRAFHEELSGPDQMAGDRFVGKKLDNLGVDGLQDDGSIRARAAFSALVAYCNNDSNEMNEALRSGEGVEGQLRLKIDLATHALSEMPEYHGISMRGTDLDDDILARYEPGETVTEKAFTSSSADRGFEGDVQFVIESRHGRNLAELSQHGDQDGAEILFPPNTSFQVLHKEELGGKTYIVMREVDG